MASTVALVRCPDYAATEGALAETLALLGGLGAFVPRGATVLVKPNLLAAAAPDKAVCTHPAVLRAVVRALREAGARVLVGDSPSLGTTGRVAEAAGIAQVCAAEGATLVPFQRKVSVAYPQGLVCKSFPLADVLAQVDLVVNLPKLKTHTLTRYTGAVKNLFGCVVGAEKPRFHLRFQDPADFAGMLVDLCGLVRPALTVLDGVMAMEGNGPRNGRPRPLGVLLAGADAAAVDAVASSLIGLGPEAVLTTALARRRQAGGVEATAVHVLGERPEQLAARDFRLPRGGSTMAWGLPAGMGDWVRRQVNPSPWAVPERCTGCGDCMAVCPPHIVTLEGGKAHLGGSGCIYCYCCQEVCPEGAVELVEGRVLHLLHHGLLKGW